MSFQTTSDYFTLKNAWERYCSFSLELLNHYLCTHRGRLMANTGGVLSLWKGHSTTIVRVAPYAGLCYAAHDYFENQFKIMLDINVLPGFTDARLD